MNNNELYHFGILGMKWGIRRYQNEDGSLTPEGRARLTKQDSKWSHKNYDKLYNKAYKKSKGELKSYEKHELSKEMDKYNADGSVSNRYAIEYNKKMAELMTQKVSDIRSPSGKVVTFVAKRGQLGVHMALATENYDASKLNRGVYEDGRVAYKQDYVQKD